MAILTNPWRGAGIPDLWPDAPVYPRTDPAGVTALLGRCPAAGQTPMVCPAGLAEAAGVGAVWLKDERARMGLGSFKALGASYVIAADAQAAGGESAIALAGRTYIAASAGNHGLSVAAGARVFGAQAVIVLAETVPDAFAARLRGKGAQVVRAGTNYEQSMQAAQELAQQNGWDLLSDSSWPGYLRRPRQVMEGYLQLAAEARAQVGATPSHVFLQAGVGGMAAAMAAYMRAVFGAGPRIVVVEPDAAPCLMESVRAGRVVTVEGPVSEMGRLDCKTPSLIALAGLARDADAFQTVTEAEAAAAAACLEGLGLATTPSGAAGVAGILSGDKEVLGLGPGARVLAVVSEEGLDE